MSSNGFNPSYNNKFLLIQFYNPVSEQIEFQNLQKFQNFQTTKKIFIFFFFLVGKISKIQILKLLEKNSRGCSRLK